jgi:hypothetical protein
MLCTSIAFYFDFLRKIANKKFGCVPWETKRAEVRMPVMEKELAISR